MKSLIYLFTLTLVFGNSLNAQTTNTWIGAVSTAWNNSSNWSNNSVPVEGESIQIQNAEYTPVLDQNRTLGAVSILENGTLTLNSTTLTVLGDWDNLGTLHSNGSTVVFNGTSHQTISGDQKFHNLQIQNEFGVSIISGSDSLSGVLSIILGDFETGNSFFILSDQNGTGSIAAIENGTIIGDIVMQRHIDITSSDWRFLSSPISNATLNSINDDIWTSGFLGSTYPDYNFFSVYTYDETVSGTSDYGYTAPSSINDSIKIGEGFMAYIGSLSIAGVIDFVGKPNTGNIDLPITYTVSDTINDGWNLLGNPYPSAIDWDHASITKTGIDNAIYIWNPELGVYSSYVNGLGTNGGSANIASCQSFYVKANALSPAIQLTENCKTSDQTPFLKETVSASPLSIFVENSYGSDETIVNKNESATINFDPSFDAVKMVSFNPNFPNISTGTQSDNHNYSINQFPDQEIAIPVSIFTGVSELHTISFSGVTSFNPSSCLFLEDLYTGTLYSLSEGTELTIHLYDTTSTARFILRIGANTYVQGNDLSCFNAADGEINFAKNTENEMGLIWRDAWGGIIANQTDVFQVSQLNNLPAGLYTVESTDELCGIRIDTIYLNQPQKITADFTVSADTIYLDENQTEITFTNESENANYYNWDLGSMGTSNLSNPTINFDIQGNHLVQLFAYQNSSCYDTKEYTVTVVSFADRISNETANTELYLSNQNLVVRNDRAEQIEIRTMTGQIIYQDQSFSHESIIDLSGIAHQVLIVTMIENGTFTSQKIAY